MTTVLLATDADWIFDEVDAALGDAETTVHRVRTGTAVTPACQTLRPDLVILDLQIGNMGGMAACMAVRQDQEAGRLEDAGVIMLLDRAADVFLARRCDADGWLVKPVDSFRLRRAANAVIGGGTWFDEAPGVVDVDSGDSVTEDDGDDVTGTPDATEAESAAASGE